MTANDHSKTLLVIPCYRESGRLRPFLTDLCNACAPLQDMSILVVDDGSGAEELQKMQALVGEFRAQYHFVHDVLSLTQNLGKGGTVYAGWEQAGEDITWLMFADADGSVPAYEIARIIELARTSGDDSCAWFASRITMLGKNVQRDWHRDVMGQVFHWAVNLLLNLRAHDTQCGCKLIPRACFQRVRAMLKLTGFTFDLDLLAALQANGCTITEVPVDWHEVPGGKIKLLRDPWRMLKDVFRIRQRIKAGDYQTSSAIRQTSSVK